MVANESLYISYWAEWFFQENRSDDHVEVQGSFASLVSPNCGSFFGRSTTHTLSPAYFAG